MGVNVNYKVQGTCPPFGVALFSGATLICSQVTSVTGSTISMSNLCYNGKYSFCVCDSDNLGAPYEICFTTPSAPSVLSVCDDTPPIIQQPNRCFVCGCVCKSIPIPSPYTGLTYICLCAQNTGSGSILSTSASRLYCNNVLIGNLTAISTGSVKISGTTIPVVIDSNDVLKYDLTTCVCAVNNVSFASMSIVGTSPVNLYPIGCNSGTTDSEVNLKVGSPNCYSIVKNNFVPAAKTVAACHIAYLNPAPPICMGCGSITISPVLSGGEIMSIRLTADTSTVGVGSLSCVQIFCCAGGVFPMTSICCVNNTCPNPSNQRITIPVSAGDIFCYCLCGVAPSAGTSARSRFKITGVTGSGGSFVPQICSTKREDGIFICCAATTAAPKAINLSQTSYNGGDGTSLSCRTFCLSSTPAMIAGECYCVCLNADLCTFGQATGSCSEICITCNGVCKMCCKIVIPAAPCAVPSVSFTVDNNDAVCIYSLAAITNSGCSGFAHSEIILSTITSVVGSFCKGTTCTSRSSITN